MNPASVIIRPIEQRDIIKVLVDLWPKLERDMFSVAVRDHIKGGEWYKRESLALQRAVKQKDCFISCIQNSTPVGYCLFNSDGHEVHLGQLFVEEHYRRFGIGKRFVRLVAETALVRGLCGVNLELPEKMKRWDREELVRFYSSCGMEYRKGREYGADKMVCRDLSRMLK